MEQENRVVEIMVEASEIVDRVDEMLSWLAIASTRGSSGREMTFYQPHFFRAEPWVHLGKETYGELMPRGVAACERTILDDEGDAVRAHVDEANEDQLRLPRWLAQQPRIAHARLIESAGKESVHETVMQQYVDGGGDNVDDQRVADGYRGHGAYHGVRYTLVSVGDEQPTGLRAYLSQLRLPQVARIFRVQHVRAFIDGRSTCEHGFFASWGGRFYDLQKRQLGLLIDGTNDRISPELEILTQAMYGWAVRHYDWTVELSLSPDRTGIGLRTDALGAREFVNMLRSSDTAEGRRRSIVHWVSEHMRRKRRLDAAASVKVAAHLRGVNRVDAGRYHARIWPALRDLERAKNGHRFDLAGAAE